MSELVEAMNFLIKSIELAQSRGAYRLEESKMIYDKIILLQKLSNQNNNGLETINEDVEIIDADDR